MSATKAPHVVLLAGPGAGHVLPMAEFARRLAKNHGFTATIITHSSLSSPTQMYASVLASLPASVTTAALPAVPLDDLPADARVETRMLTVVTRGLPNLRALLAELVRQRGHDVVAFLADMFCAQAFPLAADLGVPPYILFLSNLVLLSLMLHLPELDGATTCEYRDLLEPLRLPGCVPLRGADILDTIQDRSNPAYALMVEAARHFVLAHGFVVNTFDGMEHDTIAAFQELLDKGVYPPVYPVGPFVRPCSDDAAAQHGCLRWLDDQPDGSVLYVCFGSGGMLSVEQTAELAAGLEACGHRFLWVMQFPRDKDSSAAYLDTAGNSDNDPLSFLPEGFNERTKGVGLCVPKWAPQVEVLHHRAVGGFLSHCGWNSTLEAVDAGVPMVAWPLFAEQRMNAVMLAERGGMALRPASGKDGRWVVRSEEVAVVARELMAGEKGKAARKKATDMQKVAAEALTLEGPSRMALAAIVNKWKGAHGGAGKEPSSLLLRAMAPVHAQAHAPHMVVLTSPGAGHIVPVAEFAARLAAHHGVTATVVTFTNLSSPKHSSPLATLPPGVSVAKLRR
ncbi:Hydroquinone glucosyltransferase [Dichanthelium oligosanthes]|uniref:Glycosyltransferase n=1 Tax=Dichanthelium oligosanthes TaxID=888268 RepID=A0A1E5UWR6_9POAL|nr:Hydroquinone glucosyltransferase [Dichanthelium oligosanthes]